MKLLSAKRGGSGHNVAYSYTNTPIHMYEYVQERAASAVTVEAWLGWGAIADGKQIAGDGKDCSAIIHCFKMGFALCS